MKKIYKTYLIKKGACEDQVELFNKHYPKGIHVCADCFEDAQNAGLDVWWLKTFLYPEDPYAHGKRNGFLEEHSYMLPNFFYRRIVTKKGLQWLAKELLSTPF